MNFFAKRIIVLVGMIYGSLSIEESYAMEREQAMNVATALVGGIIIQPEYSNFSFTQSHTEPLQLDMEFINGMSVRDFPDYKSSRSSYFFSNYEALSHFMKIIYAEIRDDVYIKITMDPLDPLNFYTNF